MVVRDKLSDGRETTYKTSYYTEVQWNGKGEPEQVWEWSDGLICHGLALHCTSNLENNEHLVTHADESTTNRFSSSSNPDFMIFKFAFYPLAILHRSVAHISTNHTKSNLYNPPIYPFLPHNHLVNTRSNLILIHILNPNLNRPSMSLQFLHFSQLHDRTADISKTLRCQIRAGDVLGERAEVDAGVLLCVAVGCWVALAVALLQHGRTKGRVEQIT